MNKLMIDRTADFLFAFCNGEHEKTVNWLVSLGCQVVHKNDGQWTIQGIAGVRSALCVGMGPLDQVPVFGFLLAGAFWPQVYGGLGAEVDKRLKQPKRDAIKAEEIAEKERQKQIMDALPPDVPPAARRLR